MNFRIGGSASRITPRPEPRGALLRFSFDLLPEAVLGQLPRWLSVRYFRRGTPCPPDDTDRSDLYIVRRGTIDLCDEHGELIGKLTEGDLFPWHCRPRDHPEPCFSGRAVEDTLVYLISCAELDRLRGQHRDFSDHFEHTVAERLRNALHRIKAGSATGPDTSIRDAARIMTEHRTSALILMAGEGLASMVTDRDLRRRCIAAGLPYTTPVREIMTKPPPIPSRLNVHHLPVLDGGRVIGVISTSNLVRFQSANAVYLAGNIHKARDLATLVSISAELPELQVALVTGGASADQVGQAISAVTDAFTTRLLQLAEAELGPPRYPMPGWLAAPRRAASSRPTPTKTTPC